MSSTTRRIGKRLTWPLVCFVLFLLPSVAWAMASPVMSVPDEPDHVKRAVSLWDGQFLGPRVEGKSAVVRSIDIDGRWNGDVIPCFAFRPDVSPSDCPPAFPSDDARVSTTTYDGAFPPLFYALVGWVTLVAPTQPAFYGMRLVAAVIAAGLLASAVVALGAVIGRRLALVGVAAAATPMVFFLAGSVNPSGLEITASIALWAHVLAVCTWSTRRPATRIPSWLLVGLATSGGLLVLTRFLSPGFAFLILILGIGASPARPSALWRLFHDRRVQVAAGVVATCAIAGVAFTLTTGGLRSLGGVEGGGITDPWRTTIGLSGDFLRQMIGWFGWLDTPISTVTEVGWLLVIGALLGAALIFGRRRTVVSLLTTVALTVAVPVLVQAPRLVDHGLTWQGRHGMPLAVGVPLLAAYGAQGLVSSPGGLRRLALVLASVIAVVQVHGLWWSVHRYTVGLHATLLGLTGGRWQPPGGSILWLSMMAAYGSALVALSARRRSAAPDQPSGQSPIVHPDARDELGDERRA